MASLDHRRYVDPDFRELTNRLADELCRTIDGNFDVRIAIESQDLVFQKLRMLVNATLRTAKQGIESIRAEKEHAEQARQLMAERDRAEALAQTKADFLANMSHEIRTPMHGILGMCELMLDTDLTDEQHGLLDSLMVSAQSLLYILNDILDISKLESGHIEIERLTFDVPGLVDQVAEAFSLNARRKNLSFSAHVDPALRYAWGDPVRLRQILTNLLGNALKFTERGGVTLRVHQPDPAHLCFEVIDTGIGISADAKARLFQKFSQADASINRRFGGTGLGLAITQQLVQLMGGTIDLDSEPKQGTRFVVTLPFEPAEQMASLDPLVLESKTVLIVDDRADNRRIIDTILRRHGMTTLMAEDGFMAIGHLEERLARRQRLDLVILDARMPFLDGHQTFERMRQIAGDAMPPVLMALSNEDKDRQLSSAVAGVLTKPFVRSQLLAQVETILSQHAPAEAARVLDGPAEPRRNLRVLYAEDNEINRIMATKMIHGLVAELIMVENGRAALEALEALEARHFDLVLMDVQMPIMSGLEAVARIRQSSASYRDIPVVALTANALLTDRERFLSAGFSDYLSKPFHRADLAQLLRRWEASLQATTVAQAEAVSPVEPAPAAPAPLALLFNRAQFIDNYSVFSHEEQRELVEEASRQLLAQSERIAQAVAAADWHEAEQAAHKLAGGMGAMSLDAVALAARGLMTALQQSQPTPDVLARYADFCTQKELTTVLLQTPDALFGEMP